MKYLVFLLHFFLVGGSIYSQSKFDFNLSLSNQGQTEKVLEDFYMIGNPQVNQDDALLGDDFSVKYNATLAFVLKDSIDFRFRFGIGQRRNHYEQDFVTAKWIVDDNQNIFEFTPSIGFSKRFGRIRIGIGIEFPLFLIGKFNEDWNFTEHADSVNLSLQGIATTTMDGGKIFGINNYLNIKTNFYKNLYFYSELNYGLLFANLGGTYFDSGEVIFPSQSSLQTTTFEKTYTKTFFTPPAVQFGVGITL